MAELVGVKRQAIYDIESGRYLPNTEVALRLARHLGCRVEDLFSEEVRGSSRPVMMAETAASVSSRVSVVRVRGRLVGYPLDGSHTFGHELRAADGILEKDGGVRLFAPPESLEKAVLLLGCDPAFSLLSSHASSLAPTARLTCRFASSHRALESLAAGHAHMAGTHLHSESGSDSNVKLAGERLAGLGCTVVGFSWMEEGLMVAPGNPCRIRSVADLASKEVRFINREPGAALRILLDDMLLKSGIPRKALKGYDREVRTHNQGAQMVAYRLADAALGLPSVAQAFGLGFIPLAEARCDLVIPGDLLDHPSIRIILEVLQTRALREEMASLPGYDSSHTGKIIAEVRPLQG
jgi:molybdate-binding protein/DNA-binding XRE family transcriptional regulator